MDVDILAFELSASFVSVLHNLLLIQVSLSEIRIPNACGVLGFWGFGVLGFRV